MTVRDTITRTRARAPEAEEYDLQGGALSSPRPDTERDYRSGHEVHEGRRQTVRRSAHAGSRLNLIDAPGRSRLKCQPSSRTGENSPYGMIGGIEETSASFEPDPRLDPTRPKGDMRPFWPPHTTIKSLPTMISPLKYFATGARQVSSSMLSMAGVRCDSTSVLTPASWA